MTGHRLGGLDASFIYAETASQPLHVGGLVVCDAAPWRRADGTYDLDRLQDRVSSRLHLAPRFRQVLQSVPLGLSRPVWVDDPHFDMGRHFVRHALAAPGTRAQLHRLAARIQEHPLPRDRPLWEIHFIEGVDGGESVSSVWKIHHSLMDGAAGVEFGLLVFDLEADPPPQDSQPWVPRPPVTRASLVSEALVTEGRGLASTAAGIVRNPLESAKRLRHAFAQGRETLTRRPAPMPFTGRLGPRRAFSATALPLDLVRKAKSNHSVTVNDVLLTAVAQSIRTLLLRDSTHLDGDLTVCVPVNMRQPGDSAESTGNNSASVFCDLPLVHDDAVACLRVVSERMDALKESGAAAGVDTLMGFYDFVPSPLLGAVYRGTLGLPTHHLAVSNVRGPEFPLYLSGARVREVYPMGCPMDGKPVMVVAFSYDDRVFIGACADADLFGDVDLLIEGIETTIAELA